MSSRALLFIGHPGHELRVFGWLRTARPLTCVLTDGSGRSGRPRLAATRATLEETGSVAGPIFGAFSDGDLYAAMLAGDAAPFLTLADRLADLIVAEEISQVVGDAAEGFNPSHDLCRILLDAAVGRARRHGARLSNFQFPLVGPPDHCPPELRDRALETRLDDQGLQAKLRSARREPDLSVDVDQAIGRFGLEAFRYEILVPAAEPARGDGLPDEPPYYERHGEERVIDGKYRQVIRRREHMLPLAEALHGAAADSPPGSPR